MLPVEIEQQIAELLKKNILQYNKAKDSVFVGFQFDKLHIGSTDPPVVKYRKSKIQSLEVQPRKCDAKIKLIAIRSQMSSSVKG